MQLKLRRLSFFLVASLSVVLPACSGIETPGPRDPEEKPHAGVTIRVACPDDFSRSVVEQAGKGWAHRVGLNKLDVTLYDADRITALDEQTDVYVLPASQL